MSPHAITHMRTPPSLAPSTRSTIRKMSNQVGVGATFEDLVTGLQLEHDQLSRNGLHSGLANREISATMEPDLDGRIVLALQSRHQGCLRRNREQFSDLANLGLDHVSPKPETDPNWVPAAPSHGASTTKDRTTPQR